MAPDGGLAIVAVSRPERLTITPSARITAFAILLTTIVAPSALIAGLEMTTGRMTVAVTASEAPLLLEAAVAAPAIIIDKNVGTIRHQSQHERGRAIKALRLFCLGTVPLRFRDLAIRSRQC